MAEDREKEDSTVSPLFDKMDALLARHRGTRPDQAIPILSDEADFDELMIPVLTEVVPSDELPPDPEDPPMVSASASPKTEAVFLDLPLFELEPIEEFVASAVIDQEPQALAETLPADADSLRDILSIDFLDESAADLSSEDALTLEMPEIVFAAPAPDTGTMTDACPEAEADQFADGLSLTEPPPAAMLNEAQIAEITATVAAQIAVEISTEVAQLTRQHFAAMMNDLYNDSLRRLTDEISRDMEAHLAPRIEALVQQELRRQNLAE